MTETDDRQLTPDLTFTQFEVLRAIPKGHIFMRIDQPATWRHDNGSHGYVVTSSMRSLLERKLVVAAATFVDGRRGASITAAGYAALSKAVHHRPTKKRR